MFYLTCFVVVVTLWFLLNIFGVQEPSLVSVKDKSCAVAPAYENTYEYPNNNFNFQYNIIQISSVFEQLLSVIQII
jgi:hypothetical protein